MSCSFSYTFTAGIFQSCTCADGHWLVGENSGCLFLKIEKKKTPSEWLYTCAHMVAIPLNRCLSLTYVCGLSHLSFSCHLNFHTDFSLAPAQYWLKMIFTMFILLPVLSLDALYIPDGKGCCASSCQRNFAPSILNIG